MHAASWLRPWGAVKPPMCYVSLDSRTWVMFIVEASMLAGRGP